MCVKFSTTVSSQQRNAVTFHPGKEGWSETGFQKRNKWERFRHHTHMHMYTHSMQQPPQANTTTQHWHKAQVDATKYSEELLYQHESWWSNKTLTKKGNLLGGKTKKDKILPGTVIPSQTLVNAHGSLERLKSRDVLVTLMSHLGPVSHATPPKCADLDYFLQGHSS